MRGPLGGETRKACGTDSGPAPFVVVFTITLAVACLACGARKLPDPREAADAYAAALERGDARAVFAMMSHEAQGVRGAAEVERIVQAEREELAARAREFRSPEARVTADAKLRYEDGETVTLELRGGTFRVTSAGALPGGARSPEEALDQLRRVLARRSYAGLMRILSPATRAAVETDLRAIVAGLEHPDALSVQVTGDAATVTLDGGHHVRLRREGGIWRVDDFD